MWVRAADWKKVAHTCLPYRAVNDPIGERAAMTAPRSGTLALLPCPHSAGQAHIVLIIVSLDHFCPTQEGAPPE